MASSKQVTFGPDDCVSLSRSTGGLALAPQAAYPNVKANPCSFMGSVQSSQTLEFGYGVASGSVVAGC